LESIAQIIYTYESGGPEEHLVAIGKPKDNWESICEWKRDDYRFQARKVLEFLNENSNLSR